MPVRTDEDVARKAREMWWAFNESERQGVSFGIFPNRAMTEAERSGFELRALVLALMQQHRFHGRPRFQLGKVVATPGALDLLERTHTSARPFLQRHHCGDWGDMAVEDKHANDLAVMQGTRILSAFEIKAEKLWVITEADRSSTCLLLPSEY